MQVSTYSSCVSYFNLIYLKVHVSNTRKLLQTFYLQTNDFVYFTIVSTMRSRYIVNVNIRLRKILLVFLLLLLLVFIIIII